MIFGSLFSGIGGIDLGFERAGMKCAWQVENNKFCQDVLTKHWPDVPKYGDIRNVGKENLETVDLITGGFPCQPFSVAGKRRGTEDDRHLWPEMLRVISELKPTWVVAENVPGIINLFLFQAIFDLAREGYQTLPIVLPACSFDAPHLRYRLFIIAHRYSRKSDLHEFSREKSTDSGGVGEIVGDSEYYGRVISKITGGSSQRSDTGKAREITTSESERSSNERSFMADGSGATNEGIHSGGSGKDGMGMEQNALYTTRREQGSNKLGGCGSKDVTNAPSEGLQAREDQGKSHPSFERYSRWEAEPGLGRVVDGFPGRVDRLKALGNAVVPQVAEHIARMILEVEA